MPSNDKYKRYREKHRDRLLAKRRELRAMRSPEQIELDNQRRREAWHRSKNELSIKRKEYRKTQKFKDWYKKYTASRKERTAELARLRYQADPEKSRQHRREWCAKNRDKVNAANRRALQRHPNKSRDAAKKWYIKKMAEDPEFIRSRAIAEGHKRRAQKRSSGGKFTSAQISDLFILQGKKCATCKGKVSNKKGSLKFHIDHVMPLSKGGTNDIENIALLCAKCNLRKHKKDPDEWAKQHGLLFF